MKTETTASVCTPDVPYRNLPATKGDVGMVAILLLIVMFMVLFLTPGNHGTD